MKNAKFISSVGNISGLPKQKLPEVILCGRSNVGKSSFINALFNRKDLAKISSSPGKTRTLNYYQVENKFYIVDLPGFGYAKVSKTEREKWNKLIDDYFKADRDHKLAFQFIDSRHEPTNLDIVLNNYLNELAIPYVVMLSKVDKLKQSEKALAKKKLAKVFPELNINENVLMWSSVKKTGKNEIERLLHSLFF